MGRKTIKNKIKNVGHKKDRNRLLDIHKHVNHPAIKKQIKILNEPYQKKRGHPAYHRGMILILVIFFKSCGIHSYELMEQVCESNIVLLRFCDGKPPRADVFRRFLRENDMKIFKKIFYGGLIRFNDYQFLNFDRIFIDSTDAIANGSINNTINKKQIKALKQVNEWGLLHNGKRLEIDEMIDKVKDLKDNYENDSDMIDLINVILKKPKLYTIKNFNKIALFEKAMEENDVDTVPISFPEARIMKSKRGRYDTAFNFQLLMLAKHIIFSAYLHRDANDNNALSKIYKDLKEDIAIFIDLIKKYGYYKDNISELENLYENVKVICDSGFHSENNIQAAVEYAIKTIIMTKQLSRQNNRKKREELQVLLSKTRNDKKLEISKDDCLRVKDGYKCPFERDIKLFSVRLINSKYNKNPNLDPSLLKYEFLHQCVDCSDCPYIEKYGEKCRCYQIIDKKTPFEYQLTNDFISGKFTDDYSDRFHISEQVNAYFKGLDGILHLSGRSWQGVENEMLIMLFAHNVVRFENLIELEV